jgi:tetratricopeptide (TPR) repeat protein
VLRASFACACFSLAGCTGLSNGLLPRSHHSDRAPALHAQIAALDEKIRIAPDDAALLLQRARLLMDSGEASRALPDCERAMKVQPSWIHARIQTAECLQDIGRTGDAEKLQVTAALVRNKNKHVSESVLVYLAKEDDRVDSRPDDPAPLIARSRTLRSLRQFGLALADTEAALALNEDFGPAHLEAAYSLGEIGQRKEAVAEAKQATGLDPNNAAAWLCRGTLEAQNGDCAAAIESQTHSLKIRESLEALRERAQCLRRLGHRAEADADKARIRQLQRVPTGATTSVSSH